MGAPSRKGRSRSRQTRRGAESVRSAARSQAGRGSSASVRVGSARAQSRAGKAAGSQAVKRNTVRDASRDSEGACDDAPERCLWCNSLATQCSSREVDGVKDQCDVHHDFHKQKLIALPWQVACKLYHSGDTVSREMEIAASHFEEGREVGMSSDAASVTHGINPFYETYVKCAMLTEEDVKDLVESEGGRMTKGMTDLVKASFPVVNVCIAGTTRKSDYFVIPKFASVKVYPTLKLSTRCGTTMSSSVLPATEPHTVFSNIRLCRLMLV
jgi:hypothetical protein